jgi:hypothetical protein
MTIMEKAEKIASEIKVKMAIKKAIKLKIPELLNSSKPESALKGIIKALEISAELRLTREEGLKVISICRRLTKKY